MADDLLAGGVVVRDGFLTRERVRGLIDSAAARRARGEFRAARIGAQRIQRREDIRGDHTCWIAPPLDAEEQRLLADLEQLRLDLNRQAWLGLFDLELHYAWYPPGSGYTRHFDQPNGRSERQVSVVLYLNEAWSPAAGGALRIFGPTGAQRDIEPLTGRLVYFLAADCEHAVLPTEVARWSISGWFRRRADT